jgi:LmbE family N-acetylglucosaminyl deacetylase
VVRVEERLRRAGYRMMKLNLEKSCSESVTVLCLGAHSDDIEIGCGGTLLKLRQTYSKLILHWIVFSAAGARGEEAEKSADLFTANCEKKVTVREFRDGFLPYSGGAVKDTFEEIKQQVNPDLIFTHWHGDAHQDHRLLSELTRNTFRNHLILEYEIPKYDGDLGRPNVYVTLDMAVAEQKVNFLLEAFASQKVKPWFDRSLFMGLMRVRGMEANSPSGYAEAFYGRKVAVL